MEAYKERMRNEYRELTERLTKLDAILEKYDKGTLDFELDCPPRLLREQARVMGDYQAILEERAAIEGVVLS